MEMLNDKTQVLEWLSAIVKEPELFQSVFYSDSEIENLAADTLVLINDLETKLAGMENLARTAEQRAQKFLWEMKQQEPRLLTLEELLKLPKKTVVWEEFRNGKQPHHSVSPMIVSGEDRVLYDENGEISIDSHILEPIRMFMGEPKQRRFWTGKPTKAQREAAAWDI